METQISSSVTFKLTLKVKKGKFKQNSLVGWYIGKLTITSITASIVMIDVNLHETECKIF